MLEATLFGIATSVLRVLGSPALNEFRLLWGQEDQLERLQNTVATIRDVLHDADRKQASDVAVQGWLKQFRDVLYKADDLFDMISAKVLHEKALTGNKIGKKVRLVLSKPRHFAFMVKTAHKVKALRERLDAIASDIKGFGFLPIQTEHDDKPYRFQREQTHSYFPINEVVGREKEREDLVKMLLPQCFQDQQGVSVIVVIAIGGLGKTTLAQLVYNDERVQRGFDLCIWACINYFSCLEDVLVALLKSVTKSEVQKLDVDTLRDRFNRVIAAKRFFLVLDDVWDEDPQNWEKLKMLLDFGSPGSMVLATARSVKVAQSLSAIKPYCSLQCLSDQSAWLLFKKKALGGNHQHLSPRLVDLGQQIVKRCGNVPLFIVTIASFLKHQEERKWCSLVDDEFPVVVPKEYTKIMEVLRISYKEFPYPVKRCFSFCSLFPKNHVFEKDRLIRLWIAEGFVEPYDVNQNLEDRAEDYFFYLVDRCFFLDIKMSMKETIPTYTCQMHDLVHDLAKEVAGSESVLVDQVNAHKSWDKTLRHVSLVNSDFSFSHPMGLRTFIHFPGGRMRTNTLNKLMSNFKALRVLDLSNFRIKEIPASIGELIHLRILDLSSNYMKRLPSSICSLYLLQSLILGWCRELKELPEELGKLLSLRHLMLDGCYQLSQMPPGLATLTSLVTLHKRIMHKPGGELRYLERINNLSGSLKIEISKTGWENVTTDAQRSCLSKKSRLKALTVNFLEVETGGEVDTLMDALEPHPNLEYLEIENFGGSRKPLWFTYVDRLVILKLQNCMKLVELPPLSRLQSLKELYLGRMESMLTIEASISFDSELLFFPSLQTLDVYMMPNLRSWWLEAPAVLPTFPCVTSVSIRRCPKLTAACMPLFPLVVEDLKLWDVQEEVVWQGIGSELGSRLGGINTSSALKTLEISEIIGLRSIGEAQIRRLSALQNLSISYCSELETVSFRGLAYLTSLGKLRIVRCEKVRWVVDGDDEEEKPEVSCGHLSRLGELTISELTRSWFKGLKYLTSLETLYIYGFHEELQSVLPEANNSEEEEEEDGMPWKALQKLYRMHLEFGRTFSNRGNQQLLKGVEYLTSLRSLTLDKCTELYLSWRALLSLNHLENLEFRFVWKVINVDDSTQIQLSSTSLVHLKIAGGSGEWLHDIPWKSFPCLQFLTLWKITDMIDLPEGVQHLSSIQRLNTFGW